MKKVVSVGLPVDESLRIYKNRLEPAACIVGAPRGNEIQQV